MRDLTILYMTIVGILVIGISIFSIIKKLEIKLQQLSKNIVESVKTDYETKLEELDQRLYQYYVSCKLDELCFIGIGGGGCNILEDIAQIDPWHTFIHINSDMQALQ